jgi:hypothetical protein
MSVFLSPGVFTQEIDLSQLPTAQGGLRPAFIGTANKGPMNTPTLITTSQDFVDTFGTPFPDSYLGYAVLAYLQEGDSCFVLRVGVEYFNGIDEQLAPDAIDVSGAQIEGWGRIPVYTGIDYGYIFLREVTEANPVVIHDATVSGVTASNAKATLTLTEGTNGYVGCYDEAFSVLITTTSTDAGGVIGAGYKISSTTDGASFSGTLTAGGVVHDLSDYGLTLTFAINGGGVLTAGDIFTFTAEPDNSTIGISVEGEEPVIFTIAPAGTAAGYTNAADLAAAINTGLATASSEFSAVVTENAADVQVVAFRTHEAGNWIQLTGSCGFCAEVGVSQYSYDIPRSNLVCSQFGPYTFSSANNQVTMKVIGQAATKTLSFTVNSGFGTTAETLVSLLDAQGTVGGTEYFQCQLVTQPGGAKLPVLMSTLDNVYDQLYLQVSYVYPSTMLFAALVGIEYPYTSSYRSFWDARTTLPAIGTDGETPDSCNHEGLNYSVSQCALDNSYYQNIVGWFVATSPGTWSTGYTLGVSVFTQGVGDSAGRFVITVTDPNGVVVDTVQDVSFDPSSARYIANVVNNGGVIAGVNGNSYYQWTQRDSFLVDPSSLRVPSTFSRQFTGGANGIPSNPIFSESLDNAVVGNPAVNSGLYSLSNPEAYDFNLLICPGFTSGIVIGQALQFCESRGDVLFLVDPPFGLRPQQVIEWHNGMLYSDLAQAIDSSYGALYWSWLQINDSFNGGTIWVPPSGHVAGVYANTANVAEQWFAPAGTNRGRLTAPIAIEYNPSQGDRDALYGSGNAVNPIVNFVQEGITVFGQRTLQRESSALDRVNVRMLLIFLKKNLSQVLRQFLFEPNDSTTRAQVLAIINPFLGDVSARRGLTAFNVICDETNNTPDRIDDNELWVSVFIQPTKAVEFISLNMVLMRTDASFSATEVLAAGGVVATGN